MQNRLLDHEYRNQNMIPGKWRRRRQMRDCQVVQGPNRDNREGKKLRNLLKHWVNSLAGSVPWQEHVLILPLTAIATAKESIFKIQSTEAITY